MVNNRETGRQEYSTTKFLNYDALGHAGRQTGSWFNGEISLEDDVYYAYDPYGNSLLSTVTDGTRCSKDGCIPTTLVKTYHFDGAFNSVTGAEATVYTKSNMFFESSSEQGHILTAWETIPRQFSLFGNLLCEASFTRYFYDVNQTRIWGSYQGRYGDNHSFLSSLGWHGLRFGELGGFGLLGLLGSQERGIQLPLIPTVQRYGINLKIQDPLELNVL
jgi:hypothetical protein